MASAATSRATSMPAPAGSDRVTTASTSSLPTASASGRSSSPRSAPTSASAGPSATVSSWPPASPSTPFISILAAPTSPESRFRKPRRGDRTEPGASAPGRRALPGTRPSRRRNPRQSRGLRRLANPKGLGGWLGGSPGAAGRPDAGADHDRRIRALQRGDPGGVRPGGGPAADRQAGPAPQAVQGGPRGAALRHGAQDAEEGTRGVSGDAGDLRCRRGGASGIGEFDGEPGGQHGVGGAPQRDRPRPERAEGAEDLLFLEGLVDSSGGHVLHDRQRQLLLAGEDLADGRRPRADPGNDSKVD